MCKEWNNKGQHVDKEELENGEQDTQIPVGEAAESQANLFRSQPLETWEWHPNSPIFATHRHLTSYVSIQLNGVSLKSSFLRVK